MREALEHALLICGAWRCLDLCTCMEFLKVQVNAESWKLGFARLRQGRYPLIAFALSDKESQEMQFWTCFLIFSSVWIQILFLIANEHFYFPRRKNWALTVLDEYRGFGSPEQTGILCPNSSEWLKNKVHNLSIFFWSEVCMWAQRQNSFQNLYGKQKSRLPCFETMKGICKLVG